MRKTLFVLLACCLIATSAFAQITLEVQLNEDKPKDEAAIEDYYGSEHGRIFIKRNGEPDDQGRTPVQIELENNSDRYELFLCDHAWSKKELRKQRIFFEKGFSGESTRPVENIDLDEYQDRLIPFNAGRRYTFPDILVEEGKTYECKIPIHLVKPKPNWFCKKKKKLHSIIYCTIRVSVENKDEEYEKLKQQCDSLMGAFNKAIKNKEFCTNSLHKPPFDEQVKEYTEAKQELRDVLSRSLIENGWPKESRKYKRYKGLLDSIDKMDAAIRKYKNEKHECGKSHVTVPKTTSTSCDYCNYSFEQIYNKLDRYYKDLHNGQVKKSAIMNDVNALYRCCTTHTKHAQQWNNGNKYKSGIIEFYNKIKSY